MCQRAEQGLPLLGICNGFQVLCEAHLLPGALIRNASQTFLCKDQQLRVETNDTVWTSAYAPGEVITIVLKNGEGNYQADRRTLERLEGDNLVVFRYLAATPTVRSTTSPASPRPAQRRGSHAAPGAQRGELTVQHRRPRDLRSIEGFLAEWVEFTQARGDGRLRPVIPVAAFAFRDSFGAVADTV